MPRCLGKKRERVSREKEEGWDEVGLDGMRWDGMSRVGERGFRGGVGLICNFAEYLNICHVLGLFIGLLRITHIFN